MKAHPATEQLRSLRQLHRNEVGKKPLIALAAPAEVVGVQPQRCTVQLDMRTDDEQSRTPPVLTTAEAVEGLDLPFFLEDDTL